MQNKQCRAYTEIRLNEQGVTAKRPQLNKGSFEVATWSLPLKHDIVESTVDESGKQCIIRAWICHFTFKSP